MGNREFATFFMLLPRPGDRKQDARRHSLLVLNAIEWRCLTVTVLPRATQRPAAPGLVRRTCLAKRTTAISFRTFAPDGSNRLLDGARPRCTGRTSWPGKQPRYPVPVGCGQQPPPGSSGKEDLTIVGFVLGEPACGSAPRL